MKRIRIKATTKHKRVVAFSTRLCTINAKSIGVTENFNKTFLSEGQLCKGTHLSKLPKLEGNIKDEVANYCNGVFCTKRTYTLSNAKDLSI